MEATISKSRGSSRQGPNFLWFLLIGALLLGVVYFALSGGNAMATATDVQWGLSTEGSAAYEHFGVQVMLAADGSYMALDPGSLGLPDPNGNGRCDQISKLTGAPCRWEVFRRSGNNGENIVEVHLKSGDYQVAEFQGMEVDLASYPELQSTMFQGSTRGWLTHIGTAQWLQGLGFGRLLWEMGDKVIRALSPGSAVHVFVDKAGWWSALSAALPPNTPVQQVANNIWLYLMP